MDVDYEALARDVIDRADQGLFDKLSMISLRKLENEDAKFVEVLFGADTTSGWNRITTNLVRVVLYLASNTASVEYLTSSWSRFYHVDLKGE